MSQPIQRIQRYPHSVFPPAAGQPFSVIPTGLGIWRILSIAFDLTTSAVTGNRAVSMVTTDGTAIWQRISASAVQAASTTAHYSGFHGSMLTGAVGSHIELSWPQDGVTLYEGHSLTLSADNYDSGDQVSNICVMVEELPTGKYLYVTPVEQAQAEMW